MRQAFIESVTKLAEQDDRVVFLTGDLGYMAVEQFAEKFPDRFFNVGVAEQNLIGLCTGLAESGFIPFAYSIVTFSVLRPYEFIRNGPILHKLPVRIAGVGAGFDYGFNGSTHYGMEEIAVLRTNPGITIIAPADGKQAAAAVEQTHSLPGPIFFRLGKEDNLSVPGVNGEFSLGKAIKLRSGEDVALIVTGSIATEAIKAAELLKEHNISASVTIVSSFNPSPLDDLIDLLKKIRLAVSLEAHFIDGGLGSFVAEVIAENGLGTKLIRHGIRHSADGISGSKEFLYKHHNISAQDIVQSILEERSKI